VFAEVTTGEFAEPLNRSNSTIFDSAGYPLDSLVDKTGDGSAKSGNTLLTEIVSADGNSDTEIDQAPVVLGSFSALKKYNRFSPTSDPSSFSNDDAGYPQTSVAYAEDNVMRVQVGDGVYEPQTAEVSADISQEDLRNAARSMILKAAGWDTTTFPNQASDPGTAFDDVASLSLSKFPSIANREQGTVDHYRAQDSFGMPVASNGEDSILAGRGDAVQKSISESKYMLTRGSTHTADQRFTDDQSKSPPSNERVQALQAGIAMLGLANIIDNRVTLMNTDLESLQVSKDKVLRGPYSLGTSIKSNVSAKMRALIHSFMFQTGIYSYTACVSEGLYACFGLSSEFSALTTGISYETPNIAQNYESEILKISNNLDYDSSAYFDSPMYLSHGFWRAVSESAIRSIKNVQESAESLSGADFVGSILQTKDSLAVRIMNVFCSIGYQRLVMQGITSEAAAAGDPIKNPYDLDSYPIAPGTRQMKSRDGTLISNASLAWRNSSLPSMFILPVEAMAATLDMDYMFDPDKGANPIKGMLGSTMYDKTYVKGIRNSNAIPPIAAKLLEDRLGAEYMPFNFRDLRTNEIVAFHAFLETLTDGYTANFTETKGFGRADPIQNYSNTNRSIGLSFWVVATSKEDFDEMWFKINKLTTLVYPQYTRGRSVSQKDESASIGSIIGQTVNFEQPFSQIAGGTPVIRMRVGDLIKTNYSRSNFAKLFGVGNDSFFVTTAGVGDAVAAGLTSGLAGGTGAGSFGQDSSQQNGFEKATQNIDLRLAPFLVYAASPMELTQFTSLAQGQIASGIAQAATDVAAEFLAYYLKNGFVNPLLYGDRYKFFGNDPGSPSSRADNAGADTSTSELEFFGLKSSLILKARSTPYIASTKDENTGFYRKIKILRPVLVKYKNTVTTNNQNDTGPAYTVTINDPTVGSELNNSDIVVSAADLYVDAGQIVNIASTPGVLLSLGAIAGLSGLAVSAISNAIAAGTEGAGVPLDVPLGDFFGSTARTFTSPYNNPLTKAFEDKMGEGLAGVVKNLSFTWMDVPWEVDWNSRAPMACKVNITFAPIHDIAPGLDSNGFNRAPIYNVGQIMHDSFGSPRADGGNASRYFYRKGGTVAEQAANPENFQPYKI